MPVFRLNKALHVGRGLKAFLNLHCGLTRGEVPNSGHLEQQDSGPGNAAEEQAESLREERRRTFQQTREIREQRVEIYRLRNELDAAKELVDGGQDASSAPQGMGAGRLPDFAVIGAPRCGTSQFYGVLTRHPDVEHAARKEVHYFDRDRNFGRGTEWYRQCFPPPKWTDGRRSTTGEATPRYLADPLVPERVAELLPEARFIALLRNPVDRAHSHYHLAARQGKAESFEEALEAEIQWLERNGYDTGARPGPPTNLITTGLYVDHLRRWRRFFDDEQMLVLSSDDFFKRTADTLNQAQEFLGLPRRELNLKSTGSRRGSKYGYDTMPQETRERLEALFEPYNQRLYEYLGRDFGW